MNTIEQNLVNTTVTLDISKGFFSDGEQKDVAGVIQISVAIVTVEVASHLHVFRVRVVHGAVRVRRDLGCEVETWDTKDGPAQNLLDAMKTSIELVRQNQTMVEAMPTAVGSVAANPNPGIPV